MADTKITRRQVIAGTLLTAASAPAASQHAKIDAIVTTS